jgi:hypothetical protein
MITSLLLLLATPEATSPAPVADEIVVIGQRLKTWKGRVAQTRGALGCVTTRSAGDPEVDRIACDAMVACVTPLRHRLEAAGDKRRPKAERQAIRSAVEREVGPCLLERGDTLVADLAERRYQTSSKVQNAQD